jgi:hypothetical protein
METEGSLPCPQQPAICVNHESDQSSPRPNSISLRSILILFSHQHLGLPSGLFPSGLPTKVMCTLYI